jgi:tetratricopeptide (TPR) repeat protein
MTAAKGSDERVVLPRWRPWRNSQRSGELESLNQISSGVPYETEHVNKVDELINRLAAFARWPGIYEAADVVSTAIVLGLETYPGVSEAADVLNRADPSAARELAMRIISASSEKPSSTPDWSAFRLEMDPEQSRLKEQARVARLRGLVARQPRNALRWADLALAHTVLGNIEAAERAIRVAVSLGEGNRLILRAAARYYVHRNDLEAAWNLLTADKDLLRSDPWLLAAEIAVADMGKFPLRNINRGKMLLNSDIAPRHLSELASAISTVELHGGRRRLARQMLRQSLVDPTENALAQAEWSATNGLDVVSQEQIVLPRNFEANARHFMRLGKFDDAVSQARLWQFDQPFALDSAHLTSYMASSLTRDYRTAAIACEIGLRTNPGDLVLLNNLAFAQAHMGEVDKAAAIISEFPAIEDPRTLAIWTATQGLIAFRRGDPVNGRILYRRSIEQWRNLNSYPEMARAAIFWTIEEMHAKTKYVGEARAIVGIASQHFEENAETRALLRRLDDKGKD